MSYSHIFIDYPSDSCFIYLNEHEAHDLQLPIHRDNAPLPSEAYIRLTIAEAKKLYAELSMLETPFGKHHLENR